MALESLSDDALQKIAENRLEELSDDELSQLAGESPSSLSLEAPKESDQVTNLRNQINQLKSSGVDPAVIGPQETKLGLLEKSQPLPLSLQTGSEAFDTMGEKTAEGIATKFPNLPPQIPAAAGTAISMVPDIAMTAMGTGTGAAVGRGTKLGRIMTGPGKKAAGKIMGQALEKEGVALTGEILDTPRSGQRITEFAEGLNPLVKRTGKEIADIIEPGELNRLRVQIGDILDNLNVAQAGKEAKKLVSKTTRANLSKLKSNITEALKVAKPALKGPIEDVAAAAKRSDILKTIGKVGAGAGAIGTAYGIGSKFLQ